MSTAIQQGELDGLCGVYAIINAANHIADLDDEHRAELFNKFITKLHCKERLLTVMMKGMGSGALKQLMKCLSESLLDMGFGKIEVSSIALDNKKISKLWRSISEYINTDDEYRRIVVFGFLGMGTAHWSCITEISEERMILLDSCGLSDLERKACSCGKDKKKKYCISTREVWGIRWKPNKKDN